LVVNLSQARRNHIFVLTQFLRVGRHLVGDPAASFVILGLISHEILVLGEVRRERPNSSSRQD
jgi:hypothetical protein